MSKKLYNSLEILGNGSDDILLLKGSDNLTKIAVDDSGHTGIGTLSEIGISLKVKSGDSGYGTIPLRLVNSSNDVLFHLFGNGETYFNPSSGFQTVKHVGGRWDFPNQVTIGGPTPTTETRLFIKGSGTTSATSPFRVDNNSTEVFIIYDSKEMIHNGAPYSADVNLSINSIGGGGGEMVRYYQSSTLKGGVANDGSISANTTAVEGGIHQFGATTGSGILLIKDGTTYTDADAQLIRLLRSGTSGTMEIYDTSVSKIFFSGVSGAYSYINNGGRLGIGTTSPLTSLGVEVSSGDGITVTNSSVQMASLVYQSSFGGVLRIKDTTGTDTSLIAGEGSVSYINNGQNFGVGTSTPTVKLHVIGTGEVFRIEGTGTGATLISSRVDFKAETGGTFYNLGFVNNAGVEKGFIQYDFSGDRMALFAGGGDASDIFLRGDGATKNVFIGGSDTSPSTRLHIKGSVGTGAFRVENSSSSLSAFHIADNKEITVGETGFGIVPTDSPLTVFASVSNDTKFALRVADSSTNPCFDVRADGRAIVGIHTGGLLDFTSSFIVNAASGIDPLKINAYTVANALTVDSSGNVGIGTGTPADDAALEISSTTKAFLPPRVTTAERDAIGIGSPPVPTEGLVVYNTDNQDIEFYDGTVWKGTSNVGTVSKYSETLTGSPSIPADTPITVTHNLGTTDIMVQLWDLSDGSLITALVDNRTANTVDVEFQGTAPSGDIRIVIMG